MLGRVCFCPLNLTVLLPSCPKGSARKAEKSLTCFGTYLSEYEWFGAAEWCSAADSAARHVEDDMSGVVGGGVLDALGAAVLVFVECASVRFAGRKHNLDKWILFRRS
ncbi:hypothetical protein BDV93DRAFT_522181 [Ceratobasidium sp. AG-I]|nr:hypothetical protein BDV93DRAFT_522181 [Ceratobasidium sp. AG-I]